MDESQVKTTLYSLKADAPGSEDESDRRNGERHMTLFRVGSIMVDGRRELCLIKNISAGGMKMRAYCNLDEGQKISVELKCGQQVTGTVSWKRDNDVGVSFIDAVDVIDILSNTLEGPRPRMPRIEIECPIVVHVDGIRYEAIAHDVSQGGIKLQCSTQIPGDSDIVITLPGLAPEAGVVKWTKDGLLGVTFNRLMPLGGLVEWLRGLRDSQQRKAGSAA
ncbi:PilZ domain-containing protein [Sphingomicrobium flavum]|uniref:PilZ domain-containing protein n=1 Tax=Sphingomicrobium flavum TaxID=1229164 RepID=UPI0021ADEA34|nr:PilZ domain-containing protein [Sphingomicrobium flavum]